MPLPWQVAVAVMRRMEVPASWSAAQAAAAFAKELHGRWGMGDAACNNGVLLLLSADDQQVYISTGTGGVSGVQSARERRVQANN